MRYLRDRIALMRARLYSSGAGTTARLEQLERELAIAERRAAREASATDG